MASLPGMVRITLDDYASSLESVLLSFCIGPQVILPAPPEAVVREFEGPAAHMIFEQKAVLQDSNLGLKRVLSTEQRVHLARTAVLALDAQVAGGASSHPPIASDVLLIGTTSGIPTASLSVLRY
jgi:hypothetical protein